MTTTVFNFLFIPILGSLLIIINFILAPHNPYKEKSTPFECGIHSFLAQNRTQFTISFFIFGLLFLLFDLEILLVYPYTVSSYVNMVYGLITLVVFVLVLTLGFVFELGKDALKIDVKQLPKVFNKNTVLLLQNQHNKTTISDVNSLTVYLSPIVYYIIDCVANIDLELDHSSLYLITICGTLIGGSVLVFLGYRLVYAENSSDKEVRYKYDVITKTWAPLRDRDKKPLWNEICRSFIYNNDPGYEFLKQPYVPFEYSRYNPMGRRRIDVIRSDIENEAPLIKDGRNYNLMKFSDVSAYHKRCLLQIIAHHEKGYKAVFDTHMNDFLEASKITFHNRTLENPSINLMLKVNWPRYQMTIIQRTHLQHSLIEQKLVESRSHKPSSPAPLVKDLPPILPDQLPPRQHPPVVPPFSVDQVSAQHSNQLAPMLPPQHPNQLAPMLPPQHPNQLAPMLPPQHTSQMTPILPAQHPPILPPQDPQLPVKLSSQHTPLTAQQPQLVPQHTQLAPMLPPQNTSQLPPQQPIWPSQYVAQHLQQPSQQPFQYSAHAQWPPQAPQWPPQQPPQAPTQIPPQVSSQVPPQQPFQYPAHAQWPPHWRPR